MGVGGGFLVIPFLTLVLKLPMKVAIACSLVAVAGTACSAAAKYLRLDYANVRLGLLLGTATAAGAVAGALVGAAVEARFLMAFFGLVLVYTAYAMLRERAEDRFPAGKAAPQGRLSRSLSDVSPGTAQGGGLEYIVKAVPTGMAASGFAGLLSGMLGVGGGVVQVPVMNLAMGVPIKAAIGTSSFMIGITAVASSFLYYQKGYMDPALAGPVLVGVLIGAECGMRLMPRAPVGLLKTVFGVMLIAVAALMLLRAAGVLG